MNADYLLDYDVISTRYEGNVYLLARICGHEKVDALQRPPLNLSVVLDRSGSMAGSKLAYALHATRMLIWQLGSRDQLSLVAYDTMVNVLMRPCNMYNKDQFSHALQGVRTGGATNLSAGWLQGLQLVSQAMNEAALADGLADESLATDVTLGMVNRVLLLTDGLANQGVVDPHRLAAIARQHAKMGISTTTMGIGLDFNEDLLTTLAAEGGGSFYYIANPDDAADIFAAELQHLLAVVAQNLEVSFIASPQVLFFNQHNAYPREKQGDETIFRLGDLASSETKTLLLELTLAPDQAVGEVEIGQLCFAYDEIHETEVVHRRLHIPIVMQIVESDDDSQPSPNAEVRKAVLMQQAAHARRSAILAADIGQFHTGTQRLLDAAQAIADSLFDDEDLHREETALKDEAGQLMLGHDGYTSHWRKQTTGLLFTASLGRQQNPDLVRERRERSQPAVERDGKTPTAIEWDDNCLDLPSDTLRIGRLNDNDIVIRDDAVSKRHCQIVSEGGDYYVEDLDSTNGTYVNGAPIAGRFRLSDGDVMTILSSLFIFHAAAETPDQDQHA